MKRLIQRLQTHLILIGLVAALSACAGDDDDKLYPLGPSEPLCSGTAVGGCEEINPEYCVQVGCELLRDGAESYPRCTGERPTACDSMNTALLCVQVPGCGWAA